jgi:hypothetical protein
MPLLWALGGLLLNLVGSVAGRALVALGMGFVTYKGIGTAIDWLLAQIKDNISGLPVEVVQFLAYLWVDKAISMLFAAYTAAALIRFAGSDSMTKLVTKGG